MTFMNFEVNKGKQLSVWPFTFKKKVIWHRISGLKFVFAICQEFAILSLVKYLKRLGQTMRIDTTHKGPNLPKMFTNLLLGSVSSILKLKGFSAFI